MDSRDTSVQAASVRLELLRGMSVSRRLLRVADLMALGRVLALAGIRGREPGIAPDEAEARYAALVLGPDLAARVLAARRERAGNQKGPAAA